MATSTAGRREWTALIVLCLPLLIVSMDVSVLFFAVPSIAAALEPTATQMLWIFDIYGFVLAGLLLTMGNVADRIGRRRLLLIAVPREHSRDIGKKARRIIRYEAWRGVCDGIE